MQNAVGVELHHAWKRKSFLQIYRDSLHVICRVPGLISRFDFKTWYGVSFNRHKGTVACRTVASSGLDLACKPV